MLKAAQFHTMKQVAGTLEGGGTNAGGGCIIFAMIGPPYWCQWGPSMTSSSSSSLLSKTPSDAWISDLTGDGKRAEEGAAGARLLAAAALQAGPMGCRVWSWSLAR